MADQEKKFTKSDLQTIYERADATNKWLANADPDDLIIMKSDSRHVQDFPVGHRVAFDGRTTRFRANLSEQEIVKQRVAACREAYENAGLIANSIDLMVDFAVEGINIVHENKSIQRFYFQWAKKVKLPQIIEQVMKSYFVDGNVPILSFRGRIASPEVRRFRRAVARNGANAQKFFTDPDITRRRVIPYKYAVLDVLRLHVEGADLLGNLVYEYDLAAEDKKRLKDPSEKQSEVMNRLRDAIGDRDFNRMVTTGKLRIDPLRLSVLNYKKDGYRRWANPFLWRVIDDLKFKKHLRDMDISVVESVKNVLTVIALGDTPGGFPATPAMIQGFVKLLKTNTKSPYFVWNDLIKIIAEYPPVDTILGEEKYEQVNRDIRSALGIPEVILSGAGKGNFANSFLSVKTLLERLESARWAVVRWLEEQVTQVARAMDFNKAPKIKLRSLSLQDQESQKRLMLEMVDRGMISYQSCIEAFDEDFEIEMQRMKDEDNFRRKNETKFPYTLVKTGKFGPSLANGPSPLFELLDSDTLDSRQTDDAGLKRKQNKMAVEQAELSMKQQKENPPQPKALPTQQGSQPNAGGRPGATKKPQKTKTSPRNKPQGPNNKGAPTGKQPKQAKPATAAIDENFENAKKIFDKLYSVLSKALVKNYKLKDKRSLKDSHRHQIYDLIASVIGSFESTSEVTKKNVETLLKAVNRQKVTSESLSSSYPKLGTKIRDTVRNLIRDFNANNGYMPNKSEARDLVASAYTVL